MKRWRIYWWQFWRPRFKIDPHIIEKAFLPIIEDTINIPSALLRTTRNNARPKHTHKRKKR